jgi:hypothetical protein
MCSDATGMIWVGIGGVQQHCSMLNSGAAGLAVVAFSSLTCGSTAAHPRYLATEHSDFACDLTDVCAIQVYARRALEASDFACAEVVQVVQKVVRQCIVTLVFVGGGGLQRR